MSELKPGKMTREMFLYIGNQNVSFPYTKLHIRDLILNKMFAVFHWFVNIIIYNGYIDYFSLLSVLNLKITHQGLESEQKDWLSYKKKINPNLRIHKYVTLTNIWNLHVVVYQAFTRLLRMEVQNLCWTLKDEFEKRQ